MAETAQADPIQEFIALPREQQLSTLQQLSPDKQDKLLAKVKEYRQKSTPGAKVADAGAQLTPVTRESLTRIDPHQPVHSAADLGREVVRGVGNVGAGLLSVPLHPVASAEAIYRGLDPSNIPLEAYDLGRQLYKAPLETLEQGAGQAAFGEAAGEVVGPVTRKLADTAKTARSKIATGVTDTGPRVTRDLVKKTQAGNEAEAAKVAEKNAAEVEKTRQTNTEQDAERTAQLKQFHEKTESAKNAREVIQDAKDRKVALERGVEHLDPELKTDLETTRDAVNVQANEKYAKLNEVLKDEKAAPFQAKDEEGHAVGEPETITQHLYDVGNAPLRGTEIESPIIKSLGKRVESGELELTYNDLQGYREEIGRELRKGTLPPDTFAAYKALMPEIDNAMQEIADRHGLGKAQTDARNFYRGYAETFIDRGSPVRKAIESEERGQVVKTLTGKDQSGIEAIARYNPELARRINTVRGYATEAKGIRPSTAQVKSPAPLPPKPAPVEPKVVRPEVSKIDAADIREAKAGNLQKRAELIRRYSTRAAFYVTGYRSLVALGRAVMGDPGALEGLPVDLGEGMAVAAGGNMLANFLESPKVVKLLTEPTAKDLAQIPPELQGDLRPLVQQAQRQGIKVSPVLAALVGATAPKGPVMQRLQKTVDDYRSAAAQ